MGFETFAKHKYLNLETSRKRRGRENAGMVRGGSFGEARFEQRETVCVHDRRFGKVKRIRNNPRVRLRRAPQAESHWAIGRKHEPNRDGRGSGARVQLLNKKYWPWKQLLDFLRRSGGASGCVCDPAGVR